MLRVITVIVLVLSIVLLPYWLYLPALVISMVYFRLFWEGIALAFLVDALYGYGTWFSHYQFSVYALIIFLILLPIRDNLRFNA